jgi:tRNA modification GTPase
MQPCPVVLSLKHIYYLHLMLHYTADLDTIIALSTPPGVGAIALIRLSGRDALSHLSRHFSKPDIINAQGYTLHFGRILAGDEVIDEVMVSVFKAPRSYTGEDVVEISTHGSPYIIQRLLALFIKSGARLAAPGEFTQRAFLNGKLDLTQAEAVADLIHSQTAAAHRVAMHQMRGGFSADIARLRQNLIDFASLIELELDFSEEDVEFANRHQLAATLDQTEAYINKLIASFKTGNAIKNGIPVVIAGKPNAGKSTLLNALLNEEKAIVSDIPGTTRDFIEDVMVLNGMAYRFIDTAGLRETDDKVEAIGVERTIQKMESASLVLYLFDAATTDAQTLKAEEAQLQQKGIPYILVGNKLDATTPTHIQTLKNATKSDISFISAINGLHLEELKTQIVQKSGFGEVQNEDIIVTNMRHVEALNKAAQAIKNTQAALTSGLTSDLLAEELRQALYAMGEITGAITNDDLLGNIFSRFCIGK